MLADDICQSICCLPTTTPFFAVSFTSLLGLRRINPMKADASAADPDGVAIGDLGDAGERMLFVWLPGRCFGATMAVVIAGFAVVFPYSGGNW